MPATPLLAPDEPSPVTVHRAAGASVFFLTCDHAGRAIPRQLGRLGLAETEFDRHIAWDIGVAATSRSLADTLDATLVAQTYSRLVIDCNRPPSVPSAIPEISELTEIAGNHGLDDTARQSRVEAVFTPYHARLGDLLDERRDAGRPTVLIAMHSFTPVYKGIGRPWHIGTLYGRDVRLAHTLRDALQEEGRFVVGDNEPYSVSDETDYTIPVHGERRGLLHVGIEIRQDLIADADGQAEWAGILARRLPQALAALG